MLAEDPSAFEVIYLHIYFQISYYFIAPSSKIAELSCSNTTASSIIYSDIHLTPELLWRPSGIYLLHIHLLHHSSQKGNIFRLPASLVRGSRWPGTLSCCSELNVLESVCVSIVGQRGGLFQVGGVGGVASSHWIRYKWEKTRILVVIVLRVPLVGPDFQDNHAVRKGAKSINSSFFQDKTTMYLNTKSDTLKWKRVQALRQHRSR